MARTAERALHEFHDGWASYNCRTVDQPLPTDPVIEAFKKDVDRTLLRANLRLTPEERLLKMQGALIAVTEMRTAFKKARRERG